MDYHKDYKNHKHTFMIGSNALIRSFLVIYADSTIGDNFQTWHRFIIREKNKIGRNCSFEQLVLFKDVAK